jgi:phospholipid/cholesterol/gamma-HCH transport system permease protein
MPAAEYWNEVFQLTHFAAVLHGMIKAFFFGIIIILVSANSGLRAEGGAEGVGKSVTRAVVWSLLIVIVSDYFLTAILNVLKIY